MRTVAFGAVRLLFSSSRLSRGRRKRRITALLEGRESQFEIGNRYTDKSGDIVWVREFVSTVPDADGRPARIIALVTDITSGRRAQQKLQAVEAQLRLMIDHASAAVAMFDRNMRYNCVSGGSAGG